MAGWRINFSRRKGSQHSSNLTRKAFPSNYHLQTHTEVLRIISGNGVMDTGSEATFTGSWLITFIETKHITWPGATDIPSISIIKTMTITNTLSPHWSYFSSKLVYNNLTIRGRHSINLKLVKMIHSNYNLRLTPQISQVCCKTWVNGTQSTKLLKHVKTQ
jgi:hypothetical protein